MTSTSELKIAFPNDKYLFHRRCGQQKNKTSTIITILIALLSLFLLADFAEASTHQPLETVNATTDMALSETTHGSLLYQTDVVGRYIPAPILSTDVQIDISGMIVRTELKQTFENSGDTWLEGIYVFPLPENSAVDQLHMIIGERIIEGIIQEKSQAKRTYNQAKWQGKKASLVEQERPNLFTTSVANIGPGEKITISIEYQQTLHYQIVDNSGLFNIRFPMAITPRYIPGQPTIIHEEKISQFNGSGWALNTDQVADAERITPPIHNHDLPLNPTTLTVNINAGFPINQINSRYHQVQIEQTDSSQATIKLLNTDTVSDRDFSLSWRPNISKSPKAALFTQPVDNAYYHLIMVMPPTEGMTGSQPMPREVIYIIDTSGSMQGASIVQAKQALSLAINRLRPSDRFNIIQFNSVTDVLFDNAVEANAQNISVAKNYIRALQADGGTEMRPALEAALRNHSDANYIRQVIFLTDGAVGNEANLFQLIHNELGQSRLFTVGIGSAPNSHFMSKAAKFGRGTFTYIADVNEVQTKMAELFNKLDNPILRNIKIEWPQDRVVEIWPTRLPDLYVGEPIVLSAKTKTITGHLKISGTRANTQWLVDIPLANGHQGIGVNVLWARRKIAALMDSTHEGADKDVVRKQVIQTAIHHHLVSQYTSLVAVDVTPSRPDQEDLQTKSLKSNLPHGMQRKRVYGQLASTATPAQLQILIGFLLLMTAIVVFIASRISQQKLTETK